METNESNAVCLFLAELIAAAPVGSPLRGAILHDTLQEKVEAEKHVRVGDLSNGLPQVKNNVSVVSYKATLTVQFLVKAQPDTTLRRIWARGEAGAMAKAFSLAIDRNEKLSDPQGAARVCDVTVLREQAGWAKPNSWRYAVHYYLLQFNSR